MTGQTTPRPSPRVSARRGNVRRQLGGLALLVGLVTVVGCTSQRVEPPLLAPSETGVVPTGPQPTPPPAPVGGRSATVPVAQSRTPVGELPRVPWEGGPAYYERFPAAAAAGWTRPDFFPIGVWYESVVTQHDVDLDREAGLTTYFQLTNSSDPELIRRNHMTAFPGGPRADRGAETVGWLINDEVDMWARGGDAPWTGKFPGEGPICVPEDAGCGWTVMNTLTKALPAGDGRMRYANFGKGVMMWLSDADAARFINGWTDIVSADIYWYTDGNICAEAKNFLNVPENQCRLAANYGLTMDRIRALDARDGRLQPVLAFVQLGWPATGDDHAIQPDQIAGAVMNSIIHEARGIIYFNHNFGGPCQTQHVLRDACGAAIRPTVVELDRRIGQLAPVLNTQSVRYTFNPSLDTMLKQWNGSYYVFAMPGRGTAPGRYPLTLPVGVTATSAEVLFENRTVPINPGPTGSGVLADTFDSEHAYHIYKITP